MFLENRAVCETKPGVLVYDSALPYSFIELEHDPLRVLSFRRHLLVHLMVYHAFKYTYSTLIN